MPTYPNGTLLQAIGQAEVDLVQNGQRRWIPDAETFNCMGLNWGAIQQISLADWNATPAGAAFSSRKDGTVLIGSGPQVYVVQACQRRWIPDPPTLEMFGGWAAVKTVADADLMAIPEGAPISSEVWGYADLHTHPAVHYALGADEHGEHGLFWGKPGLRLEDAASSLPTDLSPCDADTHAGIDINPVRYLGRHKILDKLNLYNHAHGHTGSPDFNDWPHSLDILHQQMHISWIRRAYDGGLRLLIACAMDNQVLAMLWNKAFDGTWPSVPVPDPWSDFGSAKRQLDFLHQMCGANASWMGIARTSADARNLIKANKLAVILGVEMDSLTVDQIRELKQDYDVRTVIPIHLIDNSFGGVAVYQDPFNTDNHFVNGAFFQVKGDDCLQFRLSKPQDLQTDWTNATQPTDVSDQVYQALGYECLPGGSVPDCVPTSQGHRNVLGLVKDQLQSLMAEGLIIDLAHMSEKSQSEALDLADRFQYPLMNSHTAIRPDCNAGIQAQIDDLRGQIDDLNSKLGDANTLKEKQAIEAQIAALKDQITQLQGRADSERSMKKGHALKLLTQGGVIGLGTSWRPSSQSSDPVETWAVTYQELLDLGPKRGVAIGTDMNGFTSRIPFTQITGLYPITVPSGSAARAGVPGVSHMDQHQLVSRPKKFDFTQDGLAHFGLLPDFIQALSKSKLGDGVEHLFHSAEDTIRMWESIEKAAVRVPSGYTEPTPSIDPPISALRITIFTGHGDLRPNDQATAFLRFIDDRPEITIPLNNGQGWPNWSTNIVNWYLTQDPNITRNKLAGIGIRLPTFEAVRNWEINAITVVWTGQTDAGRLVSFIRNPAVRFTASNREWFLALNKPQVTSDPSTITLGESRMVTVRAFDAGVEITGAKVMVDGIQVGVTGTTFPYTFFSHIEKRQDGPIDPETGQKTYTDHEVCPICTVVVNSYYMAQVPIQFSEPLGGGGAPPQPILDAGLGPLSVPASPNAGETVGVSVTMRNTGNVPWTSYGAYELGSQNPPDNVTWGLARVSIPGGVTIVAGAQTTFNFDVTAPPTPGKTCAFQWQMVQGNRWFGATASANISIAGFDCAGIQAQIDNLKGQIDDLNSKLGDAKTIEAKKVIVAQIATLRAQITQLQAQATKQGCQ